MNILFLYHRDIIAEDGGGSRTVIARCNYLADNQDIVVYTSFRILKDCNTKVIQRPIDNFDYLAINSLIKEYRIDILAIPEGELLTSIGHQAVTGTGCKIVSEFHSMPGYESINLLASAKMNCKSYFDKFKYYTKLLVYPLYRYHIKRMMSKRFQDVCLYSNKVVVLSQSFIPEFKKQYSIKTTDNIIAIGNPLSFKTYFNMSSFDMKKNILVVGRLSEQTKRISLILRAWAMIDHLYPDWSLNIVGTGDSEAYYKEYVKMKRISNVKFHGRCSPEKFYEESSIFLMTSAYEGWGMVLTEALQKGCIPIAMNTFSSLKEIINDGEDGFIVANLDLSTFVEKIELLINDKSMRYKMANAAIQNSQRFSIDAICQKWMQLYKNI